MKTFLGGGGRVPFGERLAGSAVLGRHAWGQARYPFRPLASIRRDQVRNIRRMVDHAVRTVPYYREASRRLGISPSDIRSAEDLALFPIIDPDELRRDPARFVSQARPMGDYLEIHSAGSGGVPRTVFHDEASLLRSAAHGERARAAWRSCLSRRFGYRFAMIIPLPSSTLDLQRFWEGRVLLPPGVPTEHRIFSLFEPPERTLALLNDFRPDVIYSYGSYLEILADHLARTGAPFLRPRLIITSSSVLSCASRSYLEHECGIPVFNVYQAVEALKIGFECAAHRGIHLNIDAYPLRIIDGSGNPVPEGDSGSIVLSNLINRATVLLNYRIGDVAAFLPGPCPCGRTLPLLSWIDGRNDDWLELPSGRILHPQALCRIFREEPRIWQYQIIQDPGRIRIELLAPESCDRAAIRRCITARFAEIAGPDIVPDVAFVPVIGTTAGGKRRAVISHRRDPEDGATGVRRAEKCPSWSPS